LSSNSNVAGKINRGKSSVRKMSQIILIPVDDKWNAFGWHTISIDGHDMQAIVDALDKAEKVKGKPCVILAKTVNPHRS
jgi:transketolase N-terminal domain/subunit